jgi:NodT family efflux transporter outer membrane factor (OMF) lipoprotein
MIHRLPGTKVQRATGAALLLAFLGGCVAAPPTTPQVSQTSTQTLGLGSEAAPRFQEDWWKAFGDPQIDRLAQQALQSNPGLQGALARIRAAQAELSVVRAQDYPQISLDGQAQQQLLSNRFVIPRPYAGSWVFSGDIQARLNWSLDFWGRQAALIDKARGTAEASELDALAARLALAGTFAQTYVNLMLAWQNIDVATKAVTDRQTILDLTQSRVSSGLENEAALEQAKALLAMARIEVLRSQAQRDMAVHAIAALIGQGADAYGGIARPSPALETALPLPKTLPADLLSRRPDILAARARITAALRGRDAAHADFYPNINIAAAVGLQAVGLSSLFSADALTAGVGPALHLPIFDAGRLRARYARATADLDVAVADYNAAVVGAVRQTADALTLVASLADQRVEQQKALDSAANALKLAEERYRLGLSDQLPMLAAESTLLQARQQVAALVAEATTQRVVLLLAVGGGFNLEDKTSDNQDAKP